jgi:hypothetical protein
VTRDQRPRRPARLPGEDIRQAIYQAISDLAEAAVWLPGRYAWEKDRAAAILSGLSGDLARAAVTVRAFPADPPDWPAHSHAAAVAIATARQHEPDLARWLAAMLAHVTRADESRLAAALAAALPAALITATPAPGDPHDQHARVVRPAS